MKIAIGADHAGYELKDKIRQHLEFAGGRHERRVEKIAAIERERQAAAVKPTET